MGRLMKSASSNHPFFAPRVLLPRLGWTAVSLGIIALLIPQRFPLRTPDQQAYQSFQDGTFEEAAHTFRDQRWKGTALFMNGDFKEAAGLFAGYNTAEAAFNQGNALVMLGKYEDAAERYTHALTLQPDWEDATINRQIALTRAALLKAKGGEGTGGKLGADEIVFGDEPSPPGTGDEETVKTQEASGEELQALWLRQVQTKPADFLRSKFAYQDAHRQQTTTPTSNTGNQPEGTAP